MHFRNLHRSWNDMFSIFSNRASASYLLTLHIKVSGEGGSFIAQIVKTYVKVKEVLR